MHLTHLIFNYQVPWIPIFQQLAEIDNSENTGQKIFTHCVRKLLVLHRFSASILPYVMLDLHVFSELVSDGKAHSHEIAVNEAFSVIKEASIAWLEVKVKLWSCHKPGKRSHSTMKYTLAQNLLCCVSIIEQCVYMLLCLSTSDSKQTKNPIMQLLPSASVIFQVISDTSNTCFFAAGIIAYTLAFKVKNTFFILRFKVEGRWAFGFLNTLHISFNRLFSLKGVRLL